MNKFEIFFVFTAVMSGCLSHDRMLQHQCIYTLIYLGISYICVHWQWNEGVFAQVSNVCMYVSRTGYKTCIGQMFVSRICALVIATVLQRYLHAYLEICTGFLLTQIMLVYPLLHWAFFAFRNKDQLLVYQDVSILKFSLWYH